MEKNGAEWSRMEQNGEEWSRMEQNEEERSRMSRILLTSAPFCSTAPYPLGSILLLHSAPKPSSFCSVLIRVLLLHTTTLISILLLHSSAPLILLLHSAPSNDCDLRSSPLIPHSSHSSPSPHPLSHPYTPLYTPNPLSPYPSTHEGASICEIETDKASVSLDAQDEGFIAKILVSEGETIQVLRFAIQRNNSTDLAAAVCSADAE
jgi:hypothetical protein